MEDILLGFVIESFGGSLKSSAPTGVCHGLDPSQLPFEEPHAPVNHSNSVHVAPVLVPALDAQRANVICIAAVPPELVQSIRVAHHL